jgi:hypothetical protein
LYFCAFPSSTLLGHDAVAAVAGGRCRGMSFRAIGEDLSLLTEVSLLLDEHQPRRRGTSCQLTWVDESTFPASPPEVLENLE